MSPPDSGRRLTIRRARVYLAVGLAALVASGWLTDYHSCQRSQFWGQYFNSLSTSFTKAAARSSRLAKVDGDGTRHAVALQAASADAAVAAELEVAPLACLHFPAPGVPRRGDL